GPGIPRRDRPALYARYCRLMLILFKPWGSAADLRRQGESWPSAFDRFEKDAPSHAKFVINNMQLLHECRDSRDD
ncbi:hypothetical protein BDZ89DRAFT_894134, partial [Hymenopellis radicata]